MLFPNTFIPSVCSTNARGALILNVGFIGKEATVKLNDMSLVEYSIHLICLLDSWNKNTSDPRISNHNVRDKKIVSQLSPETLIGNLGVYRVCCHILVSSKDVIQLVMDEKKVSWSAFRGEKIVRNAAICGITIEMATFEAKANA